MPVYNNSTNTPRLNAAGQLLIGNALGNPLANTLIAGSGISITNTNGNIQIDAVGVGSAFSINTIFFYASGVYTPSPNMVYAQLNLIGGGGAGGGAIFGEGAIATGAGGGGAGFVQYLATAAEIGASQVVTVGAGGIPVVGADGGRGGDTTVGTLAGGGGGGGGLVGTPTTPFIVPGGAGIGFGGPNALLIIGGEGGFSGPNGVALPPYAFAGAGGASFYSNTTTSSAWCTGASALAQPGYPGNSWGKGGAGAMCALVGPSQMGGVGFQGLAIIVEYIQQIEVSFTWLFASATPIAMAANTGYITNFAGVINFNLPTICSAGSIVEVVGATNFEWTIGQAAGQSVVLGDLSTTVGVFGQVQSTKASDCIRLVCTQANTTFEILSSQGNLKLV